MKNRNGLPDSEDRFYLGEGVVAENSVYGQENVILVHPIDLFPHMEGRVGINDEVLTSKNAPNVDVSSTITAYWWNTEGNRITAPQLIKGERVSLFKMKNDPNVYFQTLGKDYNKRTRETVVLAFGAKNKDKDYTDYPIDSENSYTQIYDGVNGLIETRMTKDNNEKRGWLVQANGKDGIYLISDQEGNHIQINGPEDFIEIINNADTVIQLDKDKIHIKSNKEINIETETMNIQSKTINIKCETLNIQSQEYNHQSDKVTWSVQTTEISGNEFTVNAPSINLNGQVAMGGFTTTGAGGGSGGGAVKGSMEIQGTTSIQSSLQVSGPVQLSGGTSSGVIQGSYIDT